MQFILKKILSNNSPSSISKESTKKNFLKCKKARFIFIIILVGVTCSPGPPLIATKIFQTN